MQQARKPNLIWRLLKGGWDTLNFGRRLILNVVFVLLILLFIGAASDQQTPMQTRTTLIIAPEAVVVEQYSADAVQRMIGKFAGDGVPEVQLRDLVRVIRAAAHDARIERIFIRPDAFFGAGFASLREIGGALREFRDAGKEVVAYADYMEQRQYYLAAMSDEVYLHPEGAFWLEGLARYRAYFREAIEDKLGAQVHLFRAGEFKSYGEPYVRDGASPEALEADLFWMNDVWGRFLAEVSEARGLDAKGIAAMIDRTPELLDKAQGDLAAMAKEQGFVDDLLSVDQVEERLMARGAADEGELRSVDFHHYLAALGDGTALGAQPPVAVVVAEGEVVDGDQPPGVVGGRSTSALIRRAREDDTVKAVVVRVNSPGGSAFASEEIRREMELTRAAGKPVVVSMGDVAASGGYWIALGGDHVYADPSTITGSIGVFGLFVTFPDTLAKIGVRVDGAGTTRLAGALDPRRPLEPEIGNMIQTMVDKTYRDFIRRTAEVRERSEADIDAVARGRVWTGQQAVERGLVDELGGMDEALAEARRLAKLDAEAGVRYVEPELSDFERFLARFGDQARTAAMLRMLGWAPQALDPATRRELAWVRWLQPEGRLPFRTFAHCFCTL